MGCKKIQNFYQGDTVPIALNFTANGSPIDITGSVIKFTMKVNLTDADPGALQVTADLTDPVNGQALITLESVDTNALDVREYYFDIEWTNASGAKRTIINSTIRVLAQVTDS
jgi:hypothetical protein